MQILSIDPSSRAVGWAIFSDQNASGNFRLYDCGTFRPKGEDYVERCQNLSTMLRQRIIQTPDLVLVERFHFQEKGATQKNTAPKETQLAAFTTGKLCVAIGAVIGTFSDTKLRIVSGHKTKAGARLIAEKHGVKKCSEHAADAVSIGDYWVEAHKKKVLSRA